MNRIFEYIGILAIIMIGCNDTTQNNCNCRNVFLDYETMVLITDITDGDTYKITEQDELISIRLLNIDCFETRRTQRLTEQAEKANISIDSGLNLGLQAKNYAIEILLNKQVKILRDSTQLNIDVYGRLLRHIIIKDSLFSEMLKARKLSAPD